MARKENKKQRGAEKSKRFQLSALAKAFKSIARERREKPHRQLKFESLEPRVLLSADPLTASFADSVADYSYTQPYELDIDSDLISESDQAPAIQFGIDDEYAFDQTLVMGQTLE